MTNFTDRLCDFILSDITLDRDIEEDAVLAIEDTLAVALAGWHEPASRNVRRAYGASDDPAYGASGLGAEDEALIQGTAAHVLDYDDVLLTSVTHPSAASVPALLAFSARRPEVRERVLPAFVLGVAVNQALGNILGFEHYDRGWHATATIGPISTAAALAKLVRLNRDQMRSALALAAAQCGGLQRNFGTMAKPVQAGLAAANAVRAVLLAEAQVSGSSDPFGQGGYFDLYGDADARERAAREGLRVSSNNLSRKLYPCCYASHRIISAALAAHAGGIRSHVIDGAHVSIDVPYGTMRPLSVTDPHDGAEAKFCASYVAATALLTGRVVLSDFTSEAVRRPEIRRLMLRISIHEAPLDRSIPLGLEHGVVSLAVTAGNSLIASQICTAYPGSPSAPATRLQMDAKIADCLDIYGAVGSQSWTPDSFRAEVAKLTH